jgi:uncharacterized membrane protein
LPSVTASPHPPEDPPDQPDPAASARPPGPGGSGWAAIDEHDTAAEVDATFRTQRRIAVGYFGLFLVLTLAVPALALLLDWWSEGRVIGGMSPGFLMAAAGLYVLFVVLALAAASLATAVEDRMLGGSPDRPGPP